MKTDSLGKLERVDLREVWDSEAGSFTPWLAKEENITLLGDAIGIEIEVEAQEQRVGPFRADILCKDTVNDTWILIENQLESTDHKHLGQLLTYAAGLKAVTIIWIAQTFTDEHRAAMDWLNEITGDDFNFFGLEVELWRIGASAVAPKFNVVSKPNGWTKSVSDTRRRIEQGELSEYQQLLVEYWTAFANVVGVSKIIKPPKPDQQHWMGIAIGSSQCRLTVAVNNQKQLIKVELTLMGPHAKANYKYLFTEREAIEKEMGQAFVWREMPNNKLSRVQLLRESTNPTDKNDWPRQHQWMLVNLELMHRVFSKRVKALKDAGMDEDESLDEDMIET